MSGLSKIIQDFLHAHYDRKRPLVLAYSGGPDSKALLYLLLEYKKRVPFSFHLAHVDHGWRKESALQAKELEKEAKELNLPFHLKTLKGNILANREEAYRLFRLEYWKELTKEYGFEAVLLGHHGDDLAETVLKRILEGAHFTSIKGPQAISKIGELVLWRPLLSVRKQEIKNWLDQKKKKAIEDPTNLDVNYLRGKMRVAILPDLEKQFGKEVVSNLLTFSKRSIELELYLDQKKDFFTSRLEKGPWGTCLDLQGVNWEEVELRHFLLSFFKEKRITPSRENIDLILYLLGEKKAAKKVELGGLTVYIDREVLFLCDKEAPFLGEVALQEGKTVHGQWTIILEKIEKKPFFLSGWKECWKGKGFTALPEGEYTLALPPIQKNPFSKKWSDQKVPLFLRTRYPVVYCKKDLFADFFSKKGLRAPKYIIQVFVNQ